MEVIQLLISGTSQGCVYGLIALGFVLIYKATEMVNFAQGDIMMLGAFFAFTYISILEFNFFIALAATIVTMAALGALLERTILRSMIGEPPFSVLMLTIGLGFIIRAVAGAIWGNEPKSIPTPYAGGVLSYREVIIGYENIVIILGTLLICGFLFLFFKFSRLGIAMQAVSQNQLAAYYLGVPVKRIYSLVWALSAIISAVAGILIAPVSLISPIDGFYRHQGICRCYRRWIRQPSRRHHRRIDHWYRGTVCGLYLPTGFSDVSAYVVLLLMLLIRPQGIFTSMQQKKV